MTTTKRAALVADVRGWAFDVNLRDLADYVTGWQCDHFYVAEMQPRDWYPLAEYDAVFTPYHRWRVPANALPWPKRLGSLRAQWFTPTQPGPATQADIDLVNQHAGFHVVTRRNYDELAPICPGVVYLTNPVNMLRFAEPTRVRDQVVFEWNGNAGHGNDVKGLYGILEPALQQTGVRFEKAEYGTVRLPHAEMPSFFRRANVALCASLYEGASNSVLEAMAMGLALITTDCGNAREMRDAQLANFGETGIVIVERTVEAFVAAIRDAVAKGPAAMLRLGELNRAEIDARWSWAAWAPGYQSFLGMARAA